MKNDYSQSRLFFRLNEISAWQLENENSKVGLPPLQRGFVWKVKQIEELWDSIFRGFPIGSFLLSKHDDEKFDLLDGQQRATSIALGYYDPWVQKGKESEKFWSLKHIPVIWIDIDPKEKTNTQKFVIRVVTQSHPWGYSRKDNASILSVPDRRNALSIFRDNPSNKDVGYVHFSPLNIFPYDVDFPVPLSFMIKAISENGENWKENLIRNCEEKLPINYFRTKHYNGNEINYLVRLKEILDTNRFYNEFYISISNLDKIEIPSIVVKKEILNAEDEQSGEDPTLFVRLNSSGTRIAGEELIYSIYKAFFPETKKLVENIGVNFIAPSLVISMVSRLVLSEESKGNYPRPLNVNDFRKKIQDSAFKKILKEMIGDELNSPVRMIFTKAFDLLLAKDDFGIPPVLVKSIVKGSPDIFLMLLQWIKIHDAPSNYEERRKILATMTALCWFGRDNVKFVREIWNYIPEKEFWNKQVLGSSFCNKRDYVMYPLLLPSTLREYLVRSVIDKSVGWDNLYPEKDSKIMWTYRQILNSELSEDSDLYNVTSNIWEIFINKLLWCKPLILYVQRKYINQNFGDYNQMETLDDTNVPWDWDHIYPTDWVYRNWYIDSRTRFWNNCIGNLRAESFEKNRRENNRVSPSARLDKTKEESFVNINDWEYWSKITNRFDESNKEMIQIHLHAVIHRLCNIYEEWYSTLDVGEIFNYESADSN